MKNIEIIEKDVTKVKLTINPNRITIKYPLGFNDKTKRNKIENFILNEIDNKIKVLNKTYRGTFDEFGITLMNDNKQDKIRFEYENNRNS